MTPEGRIELEIFNFLRGIGIFCFKHDSVGIFDPVKKIYRKSSNPNRVAGVSDVLGIAPGGRFIAIEVKSEKGRLTDEQRKFIRMVQDNGGIAFVARSARGVALELSKYFPNDEKIRRYYQ
ncbi:MAG TPA: VRR-NUC domain-containing protein [Pseudobdellovibrionaceae bacterium]